MKNTWNLLLVIKIQLVTKLNITQINLQEEDVKYAETAVHLIIDIRTVRVAELKFKLFFNLHDPIMPKQETIGLNLFRKGGGGKKALPTSFSHETSINMGISPKNFLTFSFNPFTILV